MMQFLRPKKFAKVYAQVNDELKRDDWEHITAANVVYIQGDLKPARRVKKAGVKLLHVLEDIYDYYGLTEVGWLFVQFVLATLILQFHWSARNPSFKSVLISSLQSYGSIDYQQTTLDNVESMKEAADYMFGYMQQHTQLAIDRQLPYQSVFIGEYGNVTSARFLVNIDRTCAFGVLQCYRNVPGAGLDSSRWQLNHDARLNDEAWCGSDCIFYSSPVLSPQDHNRTKAMERLNALFNDSPFLGNYASFISLEIVTENLLDRTGYQFVSLTALRTNSVSAPRIASNFKVVADTVFMRTTFYRSAQDWVRLGLELTFVFLVLNSIRDEYLQWRLCILHVHYHEIDGGNVWWHGTIKYAKSWWNIVDVLSHMSTLGLTFSYAVFVAELNWHLAGVDAQDDRLVDLATRFKIWMYCMLGHNIVIGLRMFQFLMTHGGLRIYYNMFIFGSSLIQDFLIFFAYVFFVLGLAIAAFFQISGGNPLFAGSEQAIQSMALMTFGFLDYTTFYNNGFGANIDQQRLIQFLFWLTVILWLVVCQNLIIAIVLESWKRAMDFQEKSVASTSSFFKVIILRLVFLARWALYSAFSFRVFRQQQVKQYLYEVGIEVKDDPEWKAPEEVSKVFNRGAGFFARWAIACMPEAETLLELFSDPSLRRIYVHVVWLEKNYSEKVDMMYTEDAARPTMSVDFDIYKELSRDELHEFLHIVADATLLQSNGIWKQKLYTWTDLEHLEEYIWKVYSRDSAEEDEEDNYEDDMSVHSSLDPEGQTDWEAYHNNDTAAHKDGADGKQPLKKKAGPIGEGVEDPDSECEFLNHGHVDPSTSSLRPRLDPYARPLGEAQEDGEEEEPPPHLRQVSDPMDAPDPFYPPELYHPPDYTSDATNMRSSRHLPPMTSMAIPPATPPMQRTATPPPAPEVVPDSGVSQNILMIPDAANSPRVGSVTDGDLDNDDMLDWKEKLGIGNISPGGIASLDLRHSAHLHRMLHLQGGTSDLGSPVPSSPPVLAGGIASLDNIDLNNLNNVNNAASVAAINAAIDEPYKRRRKGNFDLEGLDYDDDPPPLPPPAPPPPPTPPPQRKAMPMPAPLLATAATAEAAALKKPLTRMGAAAHKHDKRKNDKEEKMKQESKQVKASKADRAAEAAKSKAASSSKVTMDRVEQLPRRTSGTGVVTQMVDAYNKTVAKAGAGKGRGVATGLSTPNGERNNEHPMYDVLKKVVDMSGNREAPFSVKTARRMRDSDAMSVVSDMTIHKQSSTNRSEELLAALVKEQHDTRMQLRKFESKMTTLLHMHQAMLQQQHQMQGTMEGMLNIDPGTHNGISDRQYNAMLAVSFTSRAG